MFRIHESTRTFLCRLGFILLGLMPTCCCAAYAIYVNRTSYQQQLAIEFGRRLNLIAECETAIHPLPHQIRFGGLTLRDPETHAIILRAATLTISTTERGSILHSPFVECEWSGRELFLDLCHLRLRAGDAPQHPIFVEIDRIDIHGLMPDQSKLSFYKIEAKDIAFQSGREERILFSSQPDDPLHAEIRLQRSLETDLLRHTQSPKLALQISTGSTPLPCVLFGGMDALKSFGPDANFYGELTAITTHDSQSATLTGTFSNIDLERAIGIPFSQRLSGLANVQCNNLRIENGRIVDWSGRVRTTTKGRIGRPLAMSLIGNLKLQELVPIDAANAEIEFDQFSCGVEWRNGTIQLRGLCNNGSGVMLTSNQVPVWNEPPGPIGPPTVLLKAFAPEGVMQVPALPTVAKLLEWLPIPPAMPIQQAKQNEGQISSK